MQREDDLLNPGGETLIARAAERPGLTKTTEAIDWWLRTYTECDVKRDPLAIFKAD